jgi:hypothetical protein
VRLLIVVVAQILAQETKQVEVGVDIGTQSLQVEENGSCKTQLGQG